MRIHDICHIITNITCLYIKGTRSQNFGLESTNLKYDLDMSLSEKMWCWMSDPKTIMTTYWKRTMHENWVKFFFVQWRRK